EICQGLGSDLHRLHFVVHVPVQALPPRHVGHVRVVVKVLVQLHDGKTRLTRGIATQRYSAYGLNIVGTERTHSLSGRLSNSRRGDVLGRTNRVAKGTSQNVHDTPQTPAFPVENCRRRRTRPDERKRYRCRCWFPHPQRPRVVKAPQTISVLSSY